MEGLKAYYLKHGRLADDNMNIGVGSLDEELDGSISVSMTYELLSILICMYVCNVCMYVCIREDRSDTLLLLLSLTA